MRSLSVFLLSFLAVPIGSAGDYNQLIVETIQKEMPAGGIYARYQKSKPGQEFEDLYQTVEDLNLAVGTGLAGRKLKVRSQRWQPTLDRLDP